MAVNRVPVLKRCRSLGMDPIYLGYDKKSNRELKRANRKMSEYGLQLREKQKAKFIYGVLEKPFRNYYKKAEKMPGMTGENLMVMLESRLDSVVFRLGFARTRREARQIVDHKHVTVNGKQVNIPSYLVKAGDVIEIKEKCKSMQRYKDIVEVTGGRLVPEWLDCDMEALKGTVKELAEKYNQDVLTMVGFLDGINDSLKVQNPIEEMDENTEVNLGFDKEMLYKNMVDAKADWLYELPQWDEILTPDKRKELYKSQKASGTVRKGKKIFPNDPCPCGSGKKYKKCCGKNA